MNIEINNYVKGKYIIENDKGEILAEFDNNITDLGMQAIAGHPATASKLSSYNWTANYTFGSFFYRMAALLTDNTILTFDGTGVPTGFPNYSDKVITRSDGWLQIDRIFKQKFVFSSDCIIKAIQTGTFVSAGEPPYSNAMLPTPLSFKKTEAITVTYVLQFVTDCNKVISNMNFVTNHDDGILMPPNKTNVRTIPIWVNTSSINRYTEINSAGGLFAPLQFPAQKNYPSLSYERIALYFYSDVDIYNTMISTTANLTAVPSIEYIPTPPYILRKTVNSIKYTALDNIYSTSLRFIFEPGEWPTAARGFSYMASENIGYPGVKVSERANAGIFTALQTPYNPYTKSTDMIVGIDYKFTWTRAA